MFKALTLNVQGLNFPMKRKKVHSFLATSRADVVALQETHFKSGDAYRFQSRYYTTQYHATSRNKTKGVAILISEHFPLKIDETIIDEEGRYVMVRGSCRVDLLTIASIYAP